jgi:hypothetical protein
MLTRLFIRWINPTLSLATSERDADTEEEGSSKTMKCSNSTQDVEQVLF